MIRSSLRALVLPGLAGMLLAGCATGYTYSAGSGGDYYYGQPQVQYNYPYGSPYGYGWYGWNGYGPYGYWGGYGPYGYWGGYPYGGYGGAYWHHHHVYRPDVHPTPPPPHHGPGPGPSPRTGDLDRDPPPRPMIPGRPSHPLPAPRSSVVPHPVSGTSEREHHSRIVP